MEVLGDAAPGEETTSVFALQLLRGLGLLNA